MLKQLGIALAVLFLTTAALCQENHFDVSIGGAYAFNRQTSANSIDLRPTDEAGWLASARVRLSERHSFQFNYGHTKNGYEYTAPPFQYVVQTTMAEFTGAYVYNFAPRGKFQPFVTAGGGVLVFTPGVTYVNTVISGFGAVREERPAFVYGGGVDYAVYKRIALRLQYRGLFYSNPDFHVSSLFVGGKTHTAEPAFGVVFKF
jgi:opacity protein-like surface antigen